MAHYCEKCGMTKDEKEFYTSKNLEKYPDGKLNICKKCATLFVDNWDPETYKWLLQEIDVPYIKDEWDALLAKWGTDPKKITGMTILGKYLSKMKLKQWNKYTWADGERLQQEAEDRKITAMKAQGYTGEEIENELAKDRTPPKPKELAAPATQMPSFEDTFGDNGDDEITQDLTEEDKRYLRLKWGSGYRAVEWVRLEQLYNDYMNSYDIQGAGQKDTLILICKASMRANQCIDSADIEGFQKATKVYNDLMKSAKLTAAQIKEDKNDAVDSIGELVAMCEKDGFIPRYHIDEPKDRADRVIQDMQKYTHDLVVEELGLGNLIENAVKNIERERESIQAAASNPDSFEEQEEENLFDYGGKPLEDQDYIDFEKAMDDSEDGDDV